MPGEKGRYDTKRMWYAILWAIVLFTQSSIPGERLPEVIPILGWDKLVHIVLYAILAFLIWRALYQRDKKAAWIVWVLCVVYGVSDEIHQMFVPGRYSSILDVVADAIGAGLGIWVLPRYFPRLMVSAEKSDKAEGKNHG